MTSACDLRFDRRNLALPTLGNVPQPENTRTPVCYRTSLITPPYSANVRELKSSLSCILDVENASLDNSSTLHHKSFHIVPSSLRTRAYEIMPDEQANPTPSVDGQKDDGLNPVRDAPNQLQSEAHIDAVNPVTVPPTNGEHSPGNDEELRRAREALPTVDKMIVLPDFEDWAQNILTDVAWNYYRSAADQERCK